MRFVYASNRIAEIWMNQTQNTARNTASTFFFLGDTIYSYGKHCPVARLVTNDKGHEAILFNRNRFCKHKKRVLWAINKSGKKIPLFMVNLTNNFNPSTALDDYCHALIGIHRKLEKARSAKTFYMEQSQKIVMELSVFARFFGVVNNAIEKLDN